jgi:hypothetical protein
MFLGMAKLQLPATIQPERIEQAIKIVRGQRVILDAELARLYGVTTAALNQAVRRNRDRFPSDFAFQLTRQEFTDLMSQIVISKTGRGGPRKLPWVFTEQGVAMLSSVLRSRVAIRVNVEIMRAFVRLRRLLATPGELVEQLTKLAETVQLHDEQIKTIAQVLRQLMEKPAPQPKGKIGFRPPTGEEADGAGGRQPRTGRGAERDRTSR